MLESVRPRGPRPLRTLTLLAAVALTLVTVLIGGMARGETPAPGSGRYFLAPADTDSVVVDDAIPARLRQRGIPDAVLRAGMEEPDSTLSDSLRADSLLADSLAADTLFRVFRYFPSFRRDRASASLFQREQRPLSTRLGNYWKHELRLDSTGSLYVAREIVGDEDVRIPLRLTRTEYLRQRREADLRQNWRDLALQRERQRQQKQRSGLGLNIAVPGGRQSAFSTIFGEPTVDLRVTGQADIKAGFDYRASDQQELLTGNRSQLDPDFKQDLRLGVTGTIGDKMRVDVNWDTNRDFDYQNQLKLQYTGYEDEILQSVEAGNVFLNTPSTLIRGGQSLFGIKTEWRLGGLSLTTVASQQEGQANNLSLDGGAETTPFETRPTQYDARTHFFLSYYFRNVWEQAHLQTLGQITVFDGFEGIKEIEVWKLQNLTQETDEERQVVAMVDLGEPSEIVSLADGFTTPVLPNPEQDQYSAADIATSLVPSEAVPSSFLERAPTPLTTADYQIGQFRKLSRNDYDLDPTLGYITLNTPLADDEALAVAFTYQVNGRAVSVGSINTAGGGDNSLQGDRLVLKLLRPTKLPQPAPDLNPAAWYLELRNIYRLGRNLKPTDFELDIFYEPPGQRATQKIPEVTGSDKTLLQSLGLDLANERGAPGADNLFDFFTGITIEPSEGLLIFPYLEPFGQRIADLVGNDAEAAEQFVFDDLYRLKKSNAELNKQLDVYRIRGSFKGTVQAIYDLQSFAGIIPGSVRVTSGGTKLSEGTDYIVDYQGGSLTVVNPAYLSAGRNIEIDYEQNALFQLQKKTLLGARAEYALADRLSVGSTIMRLSQKSATDKFRIGEEPIANTVWGVDGRLNLEPRWLTRAIDALPFLQTRAPSSISVTGEFAQLRPGHTQTNAFDQAQRDLQNLDGDRDFSSDQINGISYIDDFESFENTYSLLQPGFWRLSSSPAVIDAVDPLDFEADSLRTTWRAAFAWYQLNPSIRNTLNDQGVAITPAVQGVRPQDVFPNRETTSSDRTLTPLDLYFDPRQRGPYNYTTELDQFLLNPKQTWGGMIQRVPEGYTDFSLKNIEFVEFVMQVPENSAGRDAKLYVDLGVISEEVIPDNQPNLEDGLSLANLPIDDVRWARLSGTTQNKLINIDEDDRLTEDVGLDGFASFQPNDFVESLTENFQFADFLASLDAIEARGVDPSIRPFFEREKAKALIDPSGDDYRYFADDDFFRNPAFYPNGSLLQERFLYYFPSPELNAIETQSRLGSTQGNSRTPDTEDLNLNSASDDTDRYFEYQLPLNQDSLATLADPSRIDDYVIEEIKDKNGVGRGWYLVRIPVQNFTRRIGNVQDFSLIESIRIWTSGHEQPVTIRFAAMELVGSQWRESDDVAVDVGEGLRSAVPVDPAFGDPVDPLSTETRLTVSSINNFENDYLSPYGTIVTQIRQTTGAANVQAREQALVLRTENLRAGQQRAIFKTYQALDLLKYSNLRMFVHMHGELQDGTDLVELANRNLAEAREKARLFVRLGANEANDYYEYEQPLTPSDPLSNDPDTLWQTNRLFNGETRDLNSLNIELSALNQLKFARDENEAVPTDVIFWNDRNDRDPTNDIALEPSLDAFAPPGTRIGIKGTPSLNRINTIVIGIRNPDGSEHVLEDVTIWVNELRASGYDERTGWSGLMNANIQLADFAQVRGNFQLQTDGFGALSSTLDDRDQRELQDWAINTQVSLDKFLPERFGWTLPVTVEAKSNRSTPRFDPNRGDVRVQELLDAIDSNTEIDEAEKDERKSTIIDASETKTMTRSLTTRVQKRGSKSKLLRYTLDGLSGSYSFTESEASSPRQIRNESWRWSSSAGYRLAVRKPRTVRPFGFLGELPVVGVLGGLRFNYLPQGLNFTATATRRFTATRERPDVLRRQQSTDLPPEVEFDLRNTQAFGHNRQFGLQYNPFGFLNLSFDTNTDQSLDALGVDSLFSVIVVDSLGNKRRLPNTRLRDIEDSLEDGEQAFQLDSLGVRSAWNAIGRAIGFIGTNETNANTRLRTERYESRLTSSFRPKLDDIGFLDWVDLQDIGYTASFSWRNGTVGNNTGASVGTNVDLRTGITLRPKELWQKFGFYQRLEEAQREAEAAKQERKAERERQRKERKAERAAEREREKEAALLSKQQPEDAALQDELEDEDAVLREGDDTPAAAVEEPIEATAPMDQVVSEEEVEADTTSSRSGFPLPLPDPTSLLRRAFLTITGVSDINLTYNGTRGASSTNVGTGRFGDDGRLESVDVNYSLYDALFNGRGPSLGYRFGLTRDLDNRVLTENLQVKDLFTNTNRFQGRTSLNPSRALRISLNWSLDWTDREEVTLRQSADPTTTTTGDNRASVWAFGSNYLDFFQQQLDLYRENPAGVVDSSVATPPVALTNETLVEGFRQAYLFGGNTVGKRGLLPLPMPGWQINYSGISSWPLIRTLTQSATLRHSYGADYTANYRTNLAGGSFDVFQLGGQQVGYIVSRNEVNSVRVNERYQPLVGLDLNFKGNVQTTIAWNKGNSYSLNTNAQVRESKTSELTVTATYQITGLTLPFFNSKLTNRVSLSLTASNSVNDERSFLLRNALENPQIFSGDAPIEAALEVPNVDIQTETSRLLLAPKLGYQFSNRLSADFFLRYEKFNGDSRIPSNTNVNGGFNVRVSIAN